MTTLINDKAKNSLLAYAGAVADDQTIRVTAQLEEVKKALADGDARAARDALRTAVDQMVILGHVVDHLTYATEVTRLGVRDRSIAGPLESLEADLGKVKKL